MSVHPRPHCQHVQGRGSSNTEEVPAFRRTPSSLLRGRSPEALVSPSSQSAASTPVQAPPSADPVSVPSAGQSSLLSAHILAAKSSLRAAGSVRAPAAGQCHDLGRSCFG